MIWSIGNGESRNSINIDSLSGLKIGCNAIFRDYSVDHIICVDKRMVNEAIEQNINLHSAVYTRKDWFDYYKNYKNIHLVPDLPYSGTQRSDDPWHWGSGPYSILLAAMLSKSDVSMIGFDLYSKTKKVNNIYKESLNYVSEDHRAIDPRYWIYQTSKVFKIYNNIQFIIYQDNGWELPESWKLSNVKVDNIHNIC